MMRVRGIRGDSLDILPKLGAESFDSCVTDPPYGLGFMGKAWDHGVPGIPYWSNVLRVLKPGSILLAFGGTRTYHRLTCAIEDAGFEIRDCLLWLHGQGFPKGKGQLKPAWEPIVLARKPGPHPWLNIEGCRLSVADDEPNKRHTPSVARPGMFGVTGHTGTLQAGRWPANVVLSHEDECREIGLQRVHGTNPPGRGGSTGVRAEGWGMGADQIERYADTDGLETVTAWDCVPECAVRLLDEQSGERPVSGSAKNGRPSTALIEGGYGGWAGKHQGALHNDVGGASRFFYCAKASKRERGEGNTHPTVKPLALMRWLVRLVTPTGGAVLDPFVGSGTTVLACVAEGMRGTGIDSDPEAIRTTYSRLAAYVP